MNSKEDFQLFECVCSAIVAIPFAYTGKSNVKIYQGTCSACGTKILGDTVSGDFKPYYPAGQEVQRESN